MFWNMSKDHNLSRFTLVGLGVINFLKKAQYLTTALTSWLSIQVVLLDLLFLLLLNQEYY